MQFSKLFYRFNELGNKEDLLQSEKTLLSLLFIVIF